MNSGVPRSRHSTGRSVADRIIATLAGTALLATGLVAGGANAAISAQAILPAGVGDVDITGLDAGRYIVTLADDAAAIYRGGLDGMAATTPDAGEQLDGQSREVRAYSEYLEQTQVELAASVGASIDYSYTLALNGFAADLTVDQLTALSRERNVVSLAKDELLKLTAVPSTEFLGLSGPGGVWAETGGIETAGEGVVLGVVDSGIAPENPSFAGDELGTEAGSAPYWTGEGTTSFARSDGGTFAGECETGVQFELEDCTTKLIGARYFVTGFGEIGGADIGEYLSPRDGHGHGSHTASTAVGNAGVATTVGGADLGEISGVGPAAKVAAYKACWAGPDPAVTTDDGCTASDSIAAIESAVADGVDVLNFSVGGGAATDTLLPTDRAFLGAAAAGVFVAAAAGNDGPGDRTVYNDGTGNSAVDNAAPWITTVAASTIPSYEASVVLGDGRAFAGTSITVDQDPTAEPLTGPIAYAGSVAVPDAVGSERCLPGVLDPAQAAGKIIICYRGSAAWGEVYDQSAADRIAKSVEVARAGGIGMVLVNAGPTSLESDLHAVPTVHVGESANFQIGYYQYPQPTATLVVGDVAGSPSFTPVVADFSSRGPVLADGSDILKPDITAPGVAILAAGANAADEEPAWQVSSGTSMSSAHIAGLAVLYLGERPNATSAEIKSAMMTTAYPTVDGPEGWSSYPIEDGDELTDPFLHGAGHVDPTRFLEPGFVYLNDLPDWLSYIEGLPNYNFKDRAVEAIPASNLNLASITIGGLDAPRTVTRTVTSTQAGTFTATVTGLPTNYRITIEPSILTFGSAGETLSYEITFAPRGLPYGRWDTGALDWTSGDTVVHSPIALRPVRFTPLPEATGTGVAGSADISFTPEDDGDIPLATTGLIPGVLLLDPTDDDTEHSGTGEAYERFEYTVEVPDDTLYARFDLNSLGDNPSIYLDLDLELRGDDGEQILSESSSYGGGDKRIDLRNPPAGTYTVWVYIHQALTVSSFDLVAFVVAPGGAELTLTPPVISGVAGEEAAFTASWSGLAPQTSYLGAITYGETGVTTLLAVDTDGATPDEPVAMTLPVITGDPAVGRRVVAIPGIWDVDILEFTYQWQARGVDIAGATKASYVPVTADQGADITVVVTARAIGAPLGSATSEPVVVKLTSTTSLALDRSFLFPSQRTTATITVDTMQDAAPAGRVVITLDGRVRGEIAVAAGSTGTVTYKVPPLSAGLHTIRARFVPADSQAVAASSSGAKRAYKL